MENGDFSKEVTYQSGDELGETCAYLRACFEKLREVIATTSEELVALGNGDFAICVSEKKFPGETVHIQKSLKKLLGKLNDSLGNIKLSAAQNTTGLIENAMKSVSSGVEVTQKNNFGFKILAEKVEATVKSIQQISEVSELQAEHIQQITTAVDQISAVVQTNSATSEEDAAASEELSSQAAVLNQVIEQFNLYVPNEKAVAVSAKAAESIAENAKSDSNTNRENEFSKY